MMKKIYITNVSLQGRDGLLKLLYEPRGFEIQNNRETSFPIIPVIAKYQEDGDEVKVLVVRTENTDTPDNFEALLKELSELGIGIEHVKEIPVAENQSGSVNLELLMRILEEIPEESLVYSDITFGTKPMSAILLYAMSFIEKIKECEVNGIYYGEIQRKGGKPCGAFLYDLTVLKLLGDVIDQMKDLGILEMQEALGKIIRP